MYQIITIFSQADAQALRFLMAGASTDNARPILNYIYLDGARGLAVAADGFRLHTCKIPKSLHEYAGKLVKPEGVIKKGRMIFEIEENGNKALPGSVYPDYSGVIASMEKKDVFYQVAFTTQLLKKSLEKMTPGVGKINFRGPDQPYEILPEDEGDQKRVILMPAHGSNKTIELNKLYEDLGKVKGDLARLQATQPKTRLKALTASLPEEAKSLLERYQELDKLLITLENQAKDKANAEKVSKK